MKSRMVVAIAVLGTLGMGGCLKPGDPGEYLKGNTRYRAIHLDTMLRPKEKIVSKNIERLVVRFKDKWGFKKKVDVLMGPYPYEGAVVPDAIAWYDNPTGRMVEEAGWIYASGVSPYVETDMVEATAHGSEATIIVQIDGTTHRVFLLNISGNEGASVWAPPEAGAPPNSAPTVQWDARDHSSHDGFSYVEKKPGFPLSGPTPGVNTPYISFVNYVVDQATLAEVPP